MMTATAEQEQTDALYVAVTTMQELEEARADRRVLAEILLAVDGSAHNQGVDEWCGPLGTDANLRFRQYLDAMRRGLGEDAK